MFNLFCKLTKFIDDMTIGIMKIFRWGSLIIMFLILQEVIMRYIFQAPTMWSNDIQLYLSCAGRVIGFGFATMVHSHITMDLFTVNLNFRKSKALELFNYIVFYIPLMSALIYITFKRALKTIRFHEQLYSTWRPPLSPIIIFVVGAYVLMMIQVFSEIMKDIVSLQKGSDAWLKQR